MKKLGKLRAAAVATAVVAGGLTLLATPAQAATQLGGVSVQQACNNQFPGTSAVVVQNNVYGWRCMTYWSGGPVYFDGIDLSRQCRVQYGSGAYASYLNYNDPYCGGATADRLIPSRQHPQYEAPAAGDGRRGTAYLGIIDYTTTMKPIRHAKLWSAMCIVASLAITIISYYTGFMQAVQSQSPSLIIHIGAFVLAVGLVLLSVIIQMHGREN